MAKTEYKSIRVSEDVKAKAADAKRDGETWDEYVLRCSENPPEVREFVERESVDIEQTLDELADGVSMAADPGVPIQPEEFDEMQREIEQLKELIEHVPENTAHELREYV